MKFDEIKSDLVEAMSSSRPKTSGYDTQAEVVRVDGNTAWVHIPGGVDETPVALTIAAKEGDTVQVRVSGGSAWLVGNVSAPPTDDGTAIAAQSTANEALSMARATVRSTTTYYKISYSGTDPDDVPYRSTDGEDTRSPDGEDERITIPIFDWQKAMPDNVPAGMFLWTRIEIKHNDGSVAYVYSVTEKAREIFKETTLWYLSTSSTSLSGGSWSETLPAFVKNRYYWRRTRRLYTDNTVNYTEPVLDSENNALDQEGVFNRLTNNGQSQGFYIDPATGDVYINASYIMSGAFVVLARDGTEVFRADKTNRTFIWNTEHSTLQPDGSITIFDDGTNAAFGAINEDDPSFNSSLSSTSLDICGESDGVSYSASANAIDGFLFTADDGVSDVVKIFGVAESWENSGAVFNDMTLEEWAAIAASQQVERSLTKPSSLTNFSFGTTWTCKVWKNGAGTVVIKIYFNGYFTGTGTTGGTLFTLPSGFRPSETLYLVRINQSGTRYLLTISTNGTVTLANQSGVAGSSNQWFRDVISFFAAGVAG